MTRQLGRVGILLGDSLAKARGKMRPRGDFVGGSEAQRYPSVQLAPIEVLAPCKACQRRVARGDPPLPKHPYCAAHIHDGPCAR